MPICFHCGLPADQSIVALLQGRQRQFCCIGCQAVAQAIEAGGLGDFYRHREQVSSPVQTSATDFSAYDIAAVQEDFVLSFEQGLKQAQLYLVGIRCAACVWLIEKHLLRYPGIISVSVNASSHRGVVCYDPEKVALSAIFAALSDIGYQAQPLVAQALQNHWQGEQRSQLLRLGVAGIGMMQSGMVAVALHAGALQGMEDHWQALLRWVNLLMTLPILLFSAQPFFKSAWRALLARHLVMDVSVAIALSLAFSASVYATVTNSGEVYFDSIAMFTFFLLLGRYFENRVRFRNHQATAQFQCLLPLTAVLQEGRGRRTVPLKQIALGDHLWVAPGTVFPCDGTVAEGVSEADEALLTGEPLAQKKQVGDRVLAGSFNGSTGLVVRVQAVGNTTELAAIEQLLAVAQRQRPRQLALADRMAAHFVALVLLLTLAAWGFWWWLDSAKALWVALSVLVVTCPCALSLATPTVLAAATNQLRNRGMLVTGENALETLDKVDVAVLDKTGTLSQGLVAVTEVNLLADLSQDVVLQLAAALEGGSSHPIARAFQTIQSSFAVDNRSANMGAGVAGRIDGTTMRLGTPDFAFPAGKLQYPSAGLWLLLADEHRALAWIRLQDPLRPTAYKCVAQLQALGIRCILLSGDRSENVAAVAATVGIDEWQAGLLPGDKLDYVKRLQSQGHKVFMLGDGINDLPVLGGADVSCAMGSATRLAQTKADCVLLGDNLSQLPNTLKLAHQARRIIRQNLAWAFLYNAAALPLAICALVPPWAAAIGMSTSSLVVVLNALRVGRGAPDVTTGGE